MEKLKKLKLILILISLYGFYFFMVSYFEAYLLQMPSRAYRFNNSIAEKRSLQQDFGILVLGDSSTAVSVVPKLIGNSTVNISGWGASMMETFTLFDRYLKRHRPPKCIVLSGSYNNDLHYKDKLWTNYIFLNYYDMFELDKIYETSKIYNGYPSTEMSKLNFLLEGFFTKAKLANSSNVSFTSFLRSMIIGNAKMRLQIRRNLLIERRGYVGSNIPTNLKFEDFLGSELDYYKKGFKPYAAEDYYFNQILKTAAQTKTKVLFLPPPLAELPGFFTPAPYLKDMKSHLEKDLLKYEGNVYLDTIPTNYKHFFSIAHMNNVEAKLYTQQLSLQVNRNCSF
jgi:hypothetical protein